jgi:hypothetical protein
LAATAGRAIQAEGLKGQKPGRYISLDNATTSNTISESHLAVERRLQSCFSLRLL